MFRSIDTHAIFQNTRTVDLSSKDDRQRAHSGGVYNGSHVGQLFWCAVVQCSLCFILFCNFLKKSNAVVGSTVKIEANFKTWVFNQRIANRRRIMEPTNVRYGG
jgi:hypothetical protein